MKNKKLLLAIISFILLFSVLLTSCGLTPPTGGGEGGTGDEPTPPTGDEGKVDDRLFLVRNGEVNFQFIYSFDGYTADFRNHVFSSISDFNSKMGLSVSAVRDDFASSKDKCEVLIGTFVGREDYEVSKYLLGNAGYTIRAVDGKIIIMGGNEESLRFAFDTFMSIYLDFDPGTRDIALKSDLNRTVRETYSITSVSVDGVDIGEGDFKLFVKTGDEDALRAARLMQVRLYDSTGYYLELSPATGKDGIYITTVEKSEEDGFRVYEKDGSLHIECQYGPLFEPEMERYLTHIVGESVSGDIDIGGGYSREMHTVCYLDFGAVGDGVTDDFEAIRAAHGYANEHGLKIDACGDRKGEGLTFNLGQHAATIGIQTDVDWTGATFIIDDSSIGPNDAARGYNLFTVTSRLSIGTPLSGVLTSLSKGATNIGMTLDAKSLLIIYNADVMQYIRYGVNSDAGAAQQEVILVHENGDIDPSTPLLWNYSKITSVTMFPASDPDLTITGGKFITRANCAPREYTYYQRGISIRRSNVTVRDLVHIVEGETDTGAPYNGFLSVNGANHVLFDNVTFTGHKTYQRELDSRNSMGTYDISASNSNDITWKDCKQTNSITDTSRWGIMGSNYCKNLTYDGCVLSRFDAHKGMYNTTIINSEIGHAGITAIGAGYLRIENTVINSNTVVTLRSDYGSTWNGEVIIKDVTLKNNNASPTLISGSWVDHNFGYTCHLPSVTIDNITVYRGTALTVFSNFSNKDITSQTTKNPVAIGGRLTIKNNTNGYSFTTSANSTVSGAYTVYYD